MERRAVRKVALTPAAALLGLVATAVPAAAAVTNGVLTVTSDAADAITVTCTGGNVLVNDDPPGTGAAPCTSTTSIVVTGGPGANTIDLSGVSSANGFTTLTGTTVDGGGGDDTFVWNNGDGTDVVNGDAGNDRQEVNGAPAAGDIFTVTPNAPRVTFARTTLGLFSLDLGTVELLDVHGLGGDDTMTASGALADLIRLRFDGGDGNDTLAGGDGPDELLGGPGDDVLNGDPGAGPAPPSRPNGARTVRSPAPTPR